MKGATLCSGIGAPEMAMPWVDWRLSSEIEAFPREVLKYRLGAKDIRQGYSGGNALWGDFTAIRPRHLRRFGIPAPDLIVAGTPCQSFSIAGLRKGLTDPRGNLTLAFIRFCDAIDNLRRAAGAGPAWILWENVPGVFSDKGNAFGAFLAGLVGHDAAIEPPKGRSWTDAGVVHGPRRCAAWRVLDAQHHGLAQRRERVFVLARGGAGDWSGSDALLPILESVRWHPPPRREAGEDITGTLTSRAGSGGWSNSADDGAAGLMVPVAHSLRAEGFDASEEGTGRGTPLVPVAFVQNSRDEIRIFGGDGQTVGALAAEPGMKQQSYIAFSCKDHGADASALSPTLRAMPHDGSHANAGGQVAVAQTITADMYRSGGAVAGNNDQGVRNCLIQNSAVRRLTVVECARLQGFPDTYLHIPMRRWRKIDAEEAAYLAGYGLPVMEADGQWRTNVPADGPMYRALGNSMAVTVIRSIGEGIRAVRQATEPA